MGTKNGYQMKMLRATGNNETQHIYVRGDRYTEAEPREFFIHFPGGQIGISRCTDDSYWAHLSLEDVTEDKTERERKSKIIDARIDCDNLNVAESNMGDMARSDCNHVAIKIKLKKHK